MARLLLAVLAVQLVLFASVSGLFSSSKIKQGSKFELKQKVLTLGSSYTIKDEHGQPVYKVGFKTIGLGKHLELTDVSGKNEFYASKSMPSL